MDQLACFSSEAWLETFLEHPLLCEYRDLAWTETNGCEKLKFDFINRKACDGVASVCLTGLTRYSAGLGSTCHAQFYASGALCSLSELTSSISVDGPGGAINSFIQLMLDIEERVTLMREIAHKHGDAARVRQVLGFEYTHFPFMSLELQRLQDIRGSLCFGVKFKTAF